MGHGGDAGDQGGGFRLGAGEVFHKDGQGVVAAVGEGDERNVVVGRQQSVGIPEAGAGLVGHGHARFPLQRGGYSVLACGTFAQGGAEEGEVAGAEDAVGEEAFDQPGRAQG